MYVLFLILVLQGTDNVEFQICNNDFRVSSFLQLYIIILIVCNQRLC